MNATVHFINSPIVFGHKASTPAKPTWTASDRETDLSDVWLERFDPQNYLGHVCTGFFRDSTAYGACRNFGGDYPTEMTLAGIAVEDTEGTVYFDRDQVLRIFGADLVWTLERYEVEAGA